MTPEPCRCWRSDSALGHDGDDRALRDEDRWRDLCAHDDEIRGLAERLWDAVQRAECAR